jgi:hypothetical protein
MKREITWKGQVRDDLLHDDERGVFFLLRWPFWHGIRYDEHALNGYLLMYVS